MTVQIVTEPRATKYEKLPANRQVSCPHCGSTMKQKRLERHVEVHHPEAKKPAND